MLQNKPLIDLFHNELYPILWKSHHTKDYIIDFLNAYFHFSGSSRICDLEIINPKLFTNCSRIKKRIHVMFHYRHTVYYYEIKLTNQVEEEFDASFLSFAQYCYQKGDTEVCIGQIILQFDASYQGAPISHYYFRNDQLQRLEKGMDIHLIAVIPLRDIIKQKSSHELNQFERWMMLLTCTKFEEGKVFAHQDPPMLTFLHIWQQNSRRIYEQRLAQNKEQTTEFLLEQKKQEIKYGIARKLLEGGSSIEFVVQTTELPISTVIALRRELEAYQVETAHEV